MTISTILVGCDLSEHSDQALERAIAIAEAHGARVVLVHAQADDAPMAEVDNEMLKQLGEVSAAVRVVEARQLADRMDMITARGLRVDIISRVGPPGEILAAAAIEENAELIARSPAKRFWWLSITPFGDVVEPDVYCSIATLSGLGRAQRQLSASACASPSVTTS